MSNSSTAYAQAGPSNHMHSTHRTHQSHPQMRPPVVQHTSTYPHVNDVDLNMDEDDAVIFTSLAAYADALDALPLDLTRSFSDLRELDAVLGAHLSSITARLQHLAAVCEDPAVPAAERLVALKDVAEEARAYKMGGEDKIRVAVNTAETIISHTDYIDSLLKRFETVPGLAPLLNPHRFLTEAEAAGIVSNGTQDVPGSARKARRPAGAGIGLAAGATSAADAKRAAAALPSSSVATPTMLAQPTPSKKRKPPAPSAAQVAAKAARLTGPPAQELDAVPASRKNGGSVSASRKKTSTAMAPSASRDAPARLPRAAHTGLGGYVEATLDDVVSSTGRGRTGGDRKNNGGNSGGSGSGDEDASGRRGSRTARTTGGGSRRGGPEDDDGGVGGGLTGSYSSSRRRGEDEERRYSHHSHAQHDAQSGDETTGRIGRNGTMDDVRVRGLRTGAGGLMDDMLDSTGMESGLSRRERDRELGALSSSQDRGGDHDGPSGPPSNPDDESGEPRYCFCNNVAYGDMIGCDDEDCEREWFHLGCVGLQRVPQGTWYCNVCVERRSKDSKSSKSKKASRPSNAGANVGAKTKIASRR